MEILTNLPSVRLASSYLFLGSGKLRTPLYLVGGIHVVMPRFEYCFVAWDQAVETPPSLLDHLRPPENPYGPLANQGR